MDFVSENQGLSSSPEILLNVPHQSSLHQVGNLSYYLEAHPLKY